LWSEVFANPLKWFSSFVIPLMNISEEDLLNNFRVLFMDAWENIYQCQMLRKQARKGFETRLDAGLNKPEAQERIKELRIVLKAMIEIPLLDKAGHQIPETAQSMIPRIEEIISESKPRIASWCGYGETYYFESEQPENDFLKEILSHTAQAVAEMFYSVGGDESVDGPGFEKIGICPNCQIIFEKKRKDQEYCSTRCQQTMAVRRVREKQKKIL
jgi:hypothetical protein